MLANTGRDFQTKAETGEAPVVLLRPAETGLCRGTGEPGRRSHRFRRLQSGCVAATNCKTTTRKQGSRVGGSE